MDLAGYLVTIRRRWIALVLCLVAGGFGGWYTGHHPAKTYEATSRVYVNIPVGPSGNLQQTLASTEISGNVVKTYAAIANSQLVAQHIIDQLRLHESANVLKKQITATSEQYTFIIDIAVKDASPVRAATLANAASQALHDTVAGLEHGKAHPVQAQLVDKASVPTTAISPRPTKDLALGLIFGLLVGVALMAILEALDRSIKSSAQAEAAVGAPALALVPRQRGRNRLALTNAPTSAATEPYRGLRTALRYLDPDAPLRTILVTSATPGEGKTVTAANLAAAFALSGERVVVVDADLRRARLADIYGLKREVGLTTVVMRRVELVEALQSVQVPEKMAVLTSGPLPPNPSEIIGSDSMTNILRGLTEMYDVIILDSPPVLPVTDAVALSTQVDGVVLVARYGRTPRQAAAEAARRLHGVGANVAGFVLNAIPRTDARYMYADYRHAYRTLPRQGWRRPSEMPERSPSSTPI